MNDTAPAVYCECRKAAYRQTAQGLVVSFVIHPHDVPEQLAIAPLGTRYMLAICEIGDDEQPVERPSRQERYRAAPPMEQALIRAGRLPQDAQFRAWVGYMRSGALNAPEATEKGAADYIREQCCEGGSRSLIGEDQECYERFLAFELDYRIAIGQAAEPR